MSENALSGYNTLLKIDDGAGSYTTIAEVNNISGPNLSLGTEPAVAIDDLWESVVPTLLSGGELSFDLSFLPQDATHSATNGAGLLTDMKNRTKRNFQLEFPDTGSTTWRFAAYVTGFVPAATHPGGLTASVTLRITGQPVLS